MNERDRFPPLASGVGQVINEGCFLTFPLTGQYAQITGALSGSILLRVALE
ncbi:hypothetical protein [Vibrio nigripulchritudo]|uniref:hypothetical protein n=1 Tax=Vibrio nigripulchritudo TaxID=28173 RepID=UPI000A81DC6A|nr:hypothetical protein [Vibrio nigripulchritudo]